MRAASEVDAAHGIDGQRRDVLDIALHQPLESVANADDVYSLERGANGRGADDRVDAGGWTASDQDSQLLVMFHSSIIGCEAVDTLPFQNKCRKPSDRRRVPKELQLLKSV